MRRSREGKLTKREVIWTENKQNTLQAGHPDDPRAASPLGSGAGRRRGSLDASAAFRFPNLSASDDFSLSFAHFPLYFCSCTLADRATAREGKRGSTLSLRSTIVPSVAGGVRTSKN